MLDRSGKRRLVWRTFSTSVMVGVLLGGVVLVGFGVLLAVRPWRERVLVWGKRAKVRVHRRSKSVAPKSV